MRSGRIGSHTALQVCDAAEIVLGSGIERVRYRLVACQGGCGPTGLALSGGDDLGPFSTGIVWLDAAVRQKVVEILDQYAASQVPESDEANPESGDSKAEHDGPPSES
jgi:hypothetical protein